jgi:hypothetical protein
VIDLGSFVTKYGASSVLTFVDSLPDFTKKINENIGG